MLHAILFAFKNFGQLMEVEKRLFKQLNLISRGQFTIRYNKHWNLKIPEFLGVVLNKLKIYLQISLKFFVSTMD